METAVWSKRPVVWPAFLMYLLYQWLVGRTKKDTHNTNHRPKKQMVLRPVFSFFSFKKDSKQASSLSPMPLRKLILLFANCKCQDLVHFLRQSTATENASLLAGSIRVFVSFVASFTAQCVLNDLMVPIHQPEAKEDHHKKTKEDYNQPIHQPKKSNTE